MNVSIFGPERSGKTTLAETIGKKVCYGRPIFFIGKKKSSFPEIQLIDWHQKRAAIIMLDDANAYLENYDMNKKELHLKEPVVLSRYWGLVNIGIFHQPDYNLKFFVKNSQFVYVSHFILTPEVEKNPLLRGASRDTIGRGKFLFERFKRF